MLMNLNCQMMVIVIYVVCQIRNLIYNLIQEPDQI